MAPPDDNDPKVKDLDPATLADLQRWFGLPSFQQLEEEGKQPAVEEDPALAASRERLEKLLEPVDRAMVERHFRRYEFDPEELIQFRAMIDVVVDPSCALLDVGMIDRKHTIAEPREVQIPDQLISDLDECTPQALLRDLHRPELDFDKVFEVVDYAAEQRLDAAALVAELMATRWAQRPALAPAAEGRAIFAEFRRDFRAPIADIVAQLPRRQVQE